MTPCRYRAHSHKCAYPHKAGPLWQEEQRLKARFWDLQARLLDTPATTTGGVLAKFRGFYSDGETANIMAGNLPCDPLDSEFAASIYRDLELLAG